MELESRSKVLFSRQNTSFPRYFFHPLSLHIAQKDLTPMHRQKSILSFLQKSSPKTSDLKISSTQDLNRNQTQPSNLDLEVGGTDTPPEKLRRPIFPAISPEIAGGDRKRKETPFSSILHKFKRDDGSDSGNKRNRDENSTLDTQVVFGEPDENYESARKHTSVKDCSKSCISMFNDNCNGDLPNFELFPDITGPETPATRPFVPGLKRIQEGSRSVVTKQESPSFGPRKRAKNIQNPVIRETTLGEISENPRKFEWLSPSSIRDANGRQPSDPLYDKRNLYIPPDALKKMTATQKQYWSVKCQYMDVILFFKVGKFYELYEHDAEIGHKELDWKMTVSGVGKCRQVGISESGIDDAVQKLIARGYKAGRMEQLETSDQAKARGAASVIERKLVHVFTPSTTTDNIGPDAVHLLALKEGMENGSPIYGFAFLDYAALKFSVGSITDDDSRAALGALLMQVSPREIVYESSGLSKEAYKALTKYASSGSTAMQLTPVMLSNDFQNSSDIRSWIHSEGYFSGSSNSWTAAFGCFANQDLVICALGGLVGYLSRLKLDDALRNGELVPYHVYKSCLRMDGQALGNLEIFRNNVNGGQSGTLYMHLDHCITLSGKRLLRRWICHPLIDIDEINDRLNVVEELMKEHGVLSFMTENLRMLPDLERLLGRVKAAIGSSCTLVLPFIGEKMLKQRIKAFGTLVKGLRTGMDLLLILLKNNSRSLAISKVIKLPKLSELDELLKQFEAAVDDDFPHYKDHKIGDSDADTLSVLVGLFVEKSNEWSRVISALDCIDVLQSFASTVITSCGPMRRPVLLPADSHSPFSCPDSKGPMLRIKGLWHPYAVGENGNSLVPNDIYLGGSTTMYHPRTLLLTGPNMGGKSTLLRATCLAVILAQLGCYVPCDECVLSPADVIFTRLGATDRIMSGESTFFVECSETASVLRYATQDSLVLLDELGRGTSTFDGYAIAYAVFRHLVESVCCRLLFATHYHPLTKEFAAHPRVSLQHMACALTSNTQGSFGNENGLVFLYKLASGPSPESYGLQVALMAGIPKEVVEAASRASQRIKVKISDNFKSSEGRSKFSTLHEEWLKTLLAVSKIGGSCLDEDASDTFLCLWHEMKSFYGSRRAGS